MASPRAASTVGRRRGRGAGGRRRDRRCCRGGTVVVGIDRALGTEVVEVVAGASGTSGGVTGAVSAGGTAGRGSPAGTGRWPGATGRGRCPPARAGCRRPGACRRRRWPPPAAGRADRVPDGRRAGEAEPDRHHRAHHSDRRSRGGVVEGVGRRRAGGDDGVGTGEQGDDGGGGRRAQRAGAGTPTGLAGQRRYDRAIRRRARSSRESTAPSDTPSRRRSPRAAGPPGHGR